MNTTNKHELPAWRSVGHHTAARAAYERHDNSKPWGELSSNELMHWYDVARSVLDTLAPAPEDAPAGRVEPVGTWLGMGSHARQRYYEKHGKQLPDDTPLYAATSANTAQPSAPAALEDALRVLADIRKDVRSTKFGGLQCDELERQIRAMVPSETTSAPVAVEAMPRLPEPDTTHYMQWGVDRVKYHSVDQIIEFANARVAAALASHAAPAVGSKS